MALAAAGVPDRVTHRQQRTCESFKNPNYWAVAVAGLVTNPRTHQLRPRHTGNFFTRPERAEAVGEVGVGEEAAGAEAMGEAGPAEDTGGERSTWDLQIKKEELGPVS